MKFYEYANGKYEVVENINNGKDNTHVSGNYSYTYPVYPLFTIKSAIDNLNGDHYISISSVIKVKKSFVWIEEKSTHNQMSPKVMNNLFTLFDDQVLNLSKNLNPKSLL